MKMHIPERLLDQVRIVNKGKGKHQRNQSHGNGLYNIGGYGVNNMGNKHNSDSKKPFLQSPLMP